MFDRPSLDRLLCTTLGLTRPPVGVAFCDEPPAGVARFDGVQPAGCSFWKLAVERPPFYTVPSDHYNCPIGSYTHNIPLPGGRDQELSQVLGVMTGLGYLKMEEVPGIPRLPKTPAVIVYGRLGDMPVDPDAVILAGRAGGLMLLHEAAIRSGVSVQPLLGRPTCMAIPAATAGSLVSSLGCVGNRIYTDLPAEDFYSIVAWRDLPAVADELDTVTAANAALTTYHHERLSLRQ